ncbi:MAG: GTP 3',8-cyclase MoaA [gamma proteobacterium symbiont of Bathyaustriella thionipta]|nr:GTP 3',8-cyclase MoaA [gamma proteobacterium symbiont of Bathyaustriella thionipta]
MPKPADKPQGLIDPFGRHISYVRLSLTDKCNFRCFYCMPKGFRDFEEPENWLTFDEIERVMRAFAGLGVSRIRMTGGEPLVRKNLPELAQRLTALPGVQDLSVSTNAALLENHAQALAEAGVSRINVSLDSLRSERFADITGGGSLQTVINGLLAAKKAGLRPIKINMVALQGINDDEFVDMVNFCLQHEFTLRFIEAMPVGVSGRDASSHYMDLAQVRTELEQHFDLSPGVMPGGGPARYLRVGGSDLNIGFITPISQHFCETCNRVRLSVDGTLYLCLGQENRFELRPLLRQGIRDDELQAVLRKALALKPERHDFNENPERIVRIMSMTGG